MALERNITRWKSWQVDLLLILVTLIWGSTFLVVQNSIKLVGPYTFLAIRFAIGALALALIFRKRLFRMTRQELITGSIIGLFLWGGYVFQTVGLLHTTTSKAGFITGMSVVIVPLLCLIVLRQIPTLGAIIGVSLATVGLGMLSLGDKFNLDFGFGELLVLGCAFCFAAHIIAVGTFAPGKDPINLSIVQIAITSLLSIICMPIAGEPFVLPPGEIWLPALFMGVVATAFTLAVMNRVQQFTSSTRAALIYALEPVFAGIFGFFAGEKLTAAAWIGCLFIFAGMIAGELKIRRAAKPALSTPVADDKKEVLVL
jgi:drug/metabolite transporter (DMT)-like permease